MKVDESNFELFEKISNITGTDYEIVFANKDEIIGFVSEENLLNMLEDLLLEIDRLKEVNEDLIKDRDENYELKKFNPYDEYGVSESDFH